MATKTPFERCLEAPVMGIGLGVDAFDDSPDFRVLIANHRAGFDFLEMYTRGDADHSEHLRTSMPPDVPRTYHHEGLDPVGPVLCDPKAVDDCNRNIERLSPPWVVEELAVRHIRGRYTDFFFPAILNQASLDHSVANLRDLQKRIAAPLLPENAPYELVVGDMPLFEYLNGVALGAEMGIVLDLGHVWSYALCRGHGDDPLRGIEALDLGRVIEVHLAGARLEAVAGEEPIYRDLHGSGPIPESSLKMLEDLLPSLVNLRAVTIEVENATEAGACAQLAQVRSIVGRVRPDYRCTAGVGA